MSDKHHQESHTGSSKNTTQLVITVVLAIIVIVFAIIGLVKFLAGSPTTNPGVGMQQLAQAQRIQKVGAIEFRAADRPLRNGEDVYKAQCAACHATGVSGAPKFGVAADWAPRLGQGFEALVHSALKGKNAMSPQGGGEFNDLEIARGVAYMTNAGGANFPEPQPAAKATDAAQ